NSWHGCSGNPECRPVRRTLAQSISLRLSPTAKNRSLLNCKVGWRHAPPADLLSKMPPAFADDAEFPCIAHARRQALLKVQRELTIITTTITIIILGRAASVRAKPWTSALPLPFGSLRPHGLH